MSEALWVPDTQRCAASRLTAFMQQVEQEHRVAFGGDYFSLQDWSLANPALFWRALWDFCDVQADGSPEPVLLDGDCFPGARWFPEVRLNFAENLLRRRDDGTAIVSLLENGERRALSYAQLYRQVAALAAGLRGMGVRPGDRVAGFMPNVAETVIAMLAATSIGAVWSSCSPDFGINGVMDRFGQIEPKVLFAADGYYYNGRAHSSLERVAGIAEALPAIERVVLVPLVSEQPDISAIRGAVPFDQALDSSASDIESSKGDPMDLGEVIQ